MPHRFVGIYWTLPVNWANARRLPADADAAAALSRTIRYQRDRVRAWVAARHGLLVHEHAFMDTRPDRATNAAADELRRLAATLARPTRPRQRPTLVAVRFADIHHWRRNPFLDQAAEALGFHLQPIAPDPIVIDGQPFDPARHFATWRQTDIRESTARRSAARAALLAALAAPPAALAAHQAAPPAPGRWSAIATRLNDQQVPTPHGRRWTAENVRKLASRLPAASAPTPGDGQA